MPVYKGPEKKHLQNRAKRAFEDMGYLVTHSNGDLTASRNGMSVRIATVNKRDTDRCPYQWEDNKYCFVIDKEKRDDYAESIARLVPRDADWAVMGVDDDDLSVL